MRRFYAMAVLALAVMAVPARGQVQVAEEIRFNSNSSEDDVRKLGFGFGTQYTDAADIALGEQIYPPLFPPDNFYVYLTLRDSHGSEDFLLSDMRGVPDSVQSGVENDFSLVYNMRLQRGTGQRITISFPFKLRSGIDSINIVSPQAGSNLNHTFLPQGGQVTINDLITSLRMTVYFNYNRVASVADDEREGTGKLAIVPNLVRPGQMPGVIGAIPAGGRLSVIDMYGNTVWEESVREARTQSRLAVPGLSAGVYAVRLMGADGTALGGGRFIVR